MTVPSSKRCFIAYPEPVEGPRTPSYSYTPGSNPVLSGLPLAIAGAACVWLVTEPRKVSGRLMKARAASLPFLAGLLWSNAGFGSLRKVPGLNDYDPRYDPTVIRTDESNLSAKDVSGVHKFSYQGPDPHKERGTSMGAYHAAYKLGETTPVKVVEVIFRLVEDKYKGKSVFLSIRKEQVVAAAEASTARYKEGKAKGMLDGVPVAIKDEVDLEGHPKTHGSGHDFTNSKNTTSWCVRKWEEAGAIIIGKLNMHELGLDTNGNNPVTGTPLNPHNPSYYPGGSSSASATTVSSNLLPLTLGCDAGGSIRIPSAYCGIYGLKPSHNRVGRTPTSNMCYSTSVAGPMAGCMADLELGYRIMAAPDSGDGASRPLAPPAGETSSVIERKVIGICRSWFDAADPAVLNVCHAALSHYETQGYQVIEIELPYLHEGQLAHAMTILAEERSGLLDSAMLQFSAPNKIVLAIAARTSAQDFLLAQKMRSLLMSHLAHLYTKHPGLLIVTPTTPNAGWAINSTAELTRGVIDGNMSVRSMTYVWLANFSGCPAISIPVGVAEGKQGWGEVPVGLMAMGEWGGEESLLEWGRVGEDWGWSNEYAPKTRRPKEWNQVIDLAVHGH